MEGIRTGRKAGRKRARAVEKEKEQTRILHTLFAKVGDEQTGRVSLDALQVALGDSAVERHLRALDIDCAEALGMFALLDVDSMGEVRVGVGGKGRKRGWGGLPA